MVSVICLHFWFKIFKRKKKMLVCDTQLAMSLFFDINQHSCTKIGRNFTELHVDFWDAREITPSTWLFVIPFLLWNQDEKHLPQMWCSLVNCCHSLFFLDDIGLSVWYFSMPDSGGPAPFAGMQGLLRAGTNSYSRRFLESSPWCCLMCFTPHSSWWRAQPSARLCFIVIF